MTILKYVYWANPDVFQRVAGSMLGVFPMLVMFLITSVATLRERSSGTLERLMISPLGKAEFIAGYAIAFGLTSLLQATAVSSYAIWVLGLKIVGLQICLDRVSGDSIHAGVPLTSTFTEWPFDSARSDATNPA